MSWDTAILDLRTLLNDGPNDRNAFQKKVFGRVDGTNRSFRTFEFRRVTDFTDSVLSASPLGIYVDTTRVLTANVSSDNTSEGEFVLAIAPSPGQVVTASYFYRWFLDNELQNFLASSSILLGFGNDYTMIPTDLRVVAQFYACEMGYKKLAIKWSERASVTYLLEDEPDPKILGIADTYTKMAAMYHKQARDYLELYYKDRQGQALAPNFGMSFGNLRDTVPRR